MTVSDCISLWDASAEEPDYRAPLDTDGIVDVAIVGAGFTGLSTALHCAEIGLSAHVIDAEQIGFGGSGRNCGLVNAALWLPPQKVREKLGPTYGPRFIKKFGSGPEYVFSLIEKHQMRCEATRCGTIHAAHGQKGFIDLQERHKEWVRLGEPVELVEFEQVWHGKIAMTPDHLPRIHELDTNLYTPIGYNERGITTGTMFGETMAGLLTGMDVADLPLPMSSLSTVASAPIMTRLYQSAFTANQVLKAI